MPSFPFLCFQGVKRTKHPGGKQDSSQFNMKHYSHQAAWAESPYNTQIWGHVLQFQKGLSSMIANCYAGAVGLICKSSWQHTEHSFAYACRPRSLFVLSITIPLFGFDIRFMTTSIHLLVSDDSVAHTAIMYSEGSGGKARVEADYTAFPDESRHNGRLSFINTSPVVWLIRGTLLLIQKGIRRLMQDHSQKTKLLMRCEFTLLGWCP